MYFHTAGRVNHSCTRNDGCQTFLFIAFLCLLFISALAGAELKYLRSAKPFSLRDNPTLMIRIPDFFWIFWQFETDKIMQIWYIDIQVRVMYENSREISKWLIKVQFKKKRIDDSMIKWIAIEWGKARRPPENFLWFYWLKFFSLCLHWLIFQVDSGP